MVWAAIVGGLAFGVLPRSSPDLVGRRSARASRAIRPAQPAQPELDRQQRAHLRRGRARSRLRRRRRTRPPRTQPLHLARGGAGSRRRGRGRLRRSPCCRALRRGRSTTRSLRCSHTDRLSYPLNYWNAVAAWGAMTLAMGLAWSANSRRLWVRCGCACGGTRRGPHCLSHLLARRGCIGRRSRSSPCSRSRATAGRLASTPRRRRIATARRDPCRRAGSPRSPTRRERRRRRRRCWSLSLVRRACAAVAAVTGAARVDDGTAAVATGTHDRSVGARDRGARGRRRGPRR